MDTTDTDTTVDAGADEGHLAAAEKFFAQAAADKPEPKVEPKAEVKPEVKAPVKSPLDSVVKIPGQEAPKVEAPTVDDFDKKLAELKEPGEKLRPDWEKLKTITKEERAARLKVEQELAAERAAKTKLVDMSAIEASKARIAELETQVATFSEKLKAQDIRQHPDFIREVEAPKGETRKAIENLISTEGVEANVADLLSKTGKEFSKAVSELGSELTEFSRAQLYQLVNQYRTIVQKGDSIVANSEQFKTQAQQRALAENRKVFQAVQSQFLSDEFVRPQSVDEKAPDDEKAAVAAYNAARANIAKDAEQIAFGQGSEADVAKVAHEAAMFRFFMQQGLPRINTLFAREIQARDTELVSLRDRVASLEKAGTITVGDAAGQGGETRVEDMDHLAAAKKFGFR